MLGALTRSAASKAGWTRRRALWLPRALRHLRVAHVRPPSLHMAGRDSGFRDSGHSVRKLALGA
eukprot:1039680-Rhodomonas_salina.1